jgi:hypothetical protein
MNADTASTPIQARVGVALTGAYRHRGRGVAVYVQPQIDRLRHSDAKLILGGPDYHRFTFGLDLASQGWAPNVVVSNSNGTDDPSLTRLCATAQHETAAGATSDPV